MIDSLLFSVNAVFPIILVAGLGFWCRKKGTISDEFLNTGNRFCFRYCFFALMFCNVYKIEAFSDIRWNSVVTELIIIALLYCLGLMYVIFFVPDRKQKGVILQAFYRSNFAIIGIPLANNIYGEQGQIAAALISAVSIPVFNVLAVFSLTVFLGNRKDPLSKTLLSMLRKIVTNPLILGAGAGLLCIAVRPYCGEWRLATSNLKFVYKALEALSGIATWLSLVILGGRFRFSAAKGLFPQIAAGVLARLLLAPVLGMTLAVYLPSWLNLAPLSGADYAAFFALFASPIAIASVAMADQMENDSELAGQILVWTTLFSAFTLFFQAAFLRHIGLF